MSHSLHFAAMCDMSVCIGVINIYLHQLVHIRLVLLCFFIMY